MLGLLKKTLYLADQGVYLLLPCLLYVGVLFVGIRNVNAYIYKFTYKIDVFTMDIKLYVLIIFVLFCYLGLSYYYDEKVLVNEYIVLVCLSILGTFFILISNDLFFFFLVLELQNLGLYVLAALIRFSVYSVEAGVKYYIMGSLSSSLVLYGLVTLYGIFGTLNLLELQILSENFIIYDNKILIIVVAYIFFFVGLFFKLGVFPFHWWLPEVYLGSPMLSV
jgi:NADH-quinone oxidoreductase subunit N